MLGPPCAWWSGRTEFCPRQVAGELRNDMCGGGAVLRPLLDPEHSQSDRWSSLLPARQDLEGGRGGPPPRAEQILRLLSPAPSPPPGQAQHLLVRQG